MLLPYTMSDTRAPSFLSELQEQWNERRVKTPVAMQNLTSQFVVEARARVAAQPGQQVIVDSARRFSLVVPASWTITSQREGVVELRIASGTAIVAYPIAVIDALPNATTSAVQIDNGSALLSVANDRAQVVAQRANGYAMLAVTGLDASTLITQLMTGVYLSE
jgi:hypothetical protein